MNTAVITGCTKGIGASISEILMKNGCNVIGCFSADTETADGFLSDIAHYEGSCELIRADLTTFEGIDRFVSQVKKKSDKIDYLIMNAAMTDRTSYRFIQRERWDAIMHVNLYAPLFITQGLDDILSDGGRIIFIGAVMGQYPHAMSLSYAVSKAGLHQLAKNLVKEYADRKITVNVIAPGFVDTPWQKNKDPEHRKRIEDKIALKRFAEPEEVAKLCFSVIENPYINGAILNIDGGYDYI